MHQCDVCVCLDKSHACENNLKHSLTYGGRRYIPSHVEMEAMLVSCKYLSTLPYMWGGLGKPIERYYGKFSNFATSILRKHKCILFHCGNFIYFLNPDNIRKGASKNNYK